MPSKLEKKIFVRSFKIYYEVFVMGKMESTILFYFSRELHVILFNLCPFAVYYLRYGVRPLFTMSRIFPADGKRAG